MSEQKLSDETKLSDLTVGEFKQLIRELLSDVTPMPVVQDIALPEEETPVAKKRSLDELMNDLEG